MQYTRPQFSAPTSNGRLTDKEYEIAVGLRQPDEPDPFTAYLEWEVSIGIRCKGCRKYHENCRCDKKDPK